MDHKDVNRLIEAINGIKAWLIVIWIALLGIMAFTAVANAADHAIGDLKSVTIRFKNDSELKLKTQWFVNGCDTTREISSSYIHAHGENDLQRALKNMPEGGREIIRIDTLATNRYDLHYKVERLSVFCRTLLSPPDVRKEPVISRSWNDDGSYSLVKGKEVTIDGFTTVGYYQACDTTEGEALLWYNEVLVLDKWFEARRKR